jgi:predicted HTH domain antitoxin
VCRVDRKWLKNTVAAVKTLEIQLSDRAVVGLDLDLGELASELRVAAAVKWYEVGRVSQEVAAEVAGMSRSEFVSALSHFRVSPMQETASEAMQAAQTVLAK